MGSIDLSLRQRKLLHFIQSQNGYITGNELANQLNITSRTIRNDISEINKILLPYGIQIEAKKSLGYTLRVDNMQKLKELNKMSESFLTRDDRIRYMTFRLCLSDEPVNLFDLEDEMFVSRTALEHDLIALLEKFVSPYPHIGFKRSKNWISFENDERKIRMILNQLFTENWNYNARGNAYYQYQYLEESVINRIMDKVDDTLSLYDILLEDVNMVILDLAIGIMYYRIKSGHMLTDLVPCHLDDSSARQAVDDLLNSLEKELECPFPLEEREEIYAHVANQRLLDASRLNFLSVPNYFNAKIIQLADIYIKKVNHFFHIDFSGDEDFYITLLQYIRYLEMPSHYLNQIFDNMDITRLNLLVEIEIAFLFQDFAMEYFGRYLNGIELMYLAFCISGALAYVNRTSPKLKTVIMCHLNIPVIWYMKQQLLNEFNNYIELTALLPVHAKSRFDFTNIDLIITTANKTIDADSMSKTVLVSPFLQLSDKIHINSFIFKVKTKNLYRSDLPSIDFLLSHAFWHEQIQTINHVQLIELMAADFIDNQLVSPDYLQKLLIREATLTFAFQPGIVLMYSITPSIQTCLSIATLEHRIKWNNYKIRTVIMAAIQPDHSAFIFSLINGLFYIDYSSNDVKFLKTKEEVMSYLKNKLYQ